MQCSPAWETDRQTYEQPASRIPADFGPSLRLAFKSPLPSPSSPRGGEKESHYLRPPSFRDSFFAASSSFHSRFFWGFYPLFPLHDRFLCPRLSTTFPRMAPWVLFSFIVALEASRGAEGVLFLEVFSACECSRMRV